MNNMTDNQTINLQRRNALKVGGGLGLLALFGSLGLVGNVMAESDRKAFAAKSMDEALTAMGVIIPENSDAIKLTVPEIAENGAAVIADADQSKITGAFDRFMKTTELSFPPVFGDGHAAEFICRKILDHIY